jgi:hypothetical protein
MHMRTSSNQSLFEEKVRTMVEGLRGITVATTPLVFRGETLIPAQVIARLHEITGTFEAVREHESKHQAAIEACAKGMKDFHSFYDEAVIVVKGHFGSDPKKLATFGIRSAKKGHPSVHPQRRKSEEVVTEVTVKAELPGHEPIVEKVEVKEVIVQAPANHREPRRRRKARKGSDYPSVVPATALPATKPSIAKASRKGGRR